MAVALANGLLGEGRILGRQQNLLRFYSIAIQSSADPRVITGGVWVSAQRQPVAKILRAALDRLRKRRIGT